MVTRFWPRDKTLAVFTKEWITFRKTFRTAFWDRDFNYVRSHALQTPSQSRPGSAHCEVIFCSHCAVRADWPMHGFSAHFQNAHASESRCERTLRSHFLESGFLRGSRSKRPGSAHCEVIFCSHCAVCADWPMHGISAHFQNAESLCERTLRSHFLESGFLRGSRSKRQFFRVSKVCFKSLIPKELCVHKG